MMIAEELEADWSTIRVEQAPMVPSRSIKPWHGWQWWRWNGLGYMRKVGAQARELLLTAAAKNGK